MGYKGSLASLIIFTIMILLPVAGSIVFMTISFLNTLASKKKSVEQGINLNKSWMQDYFKLLFLCVGIIYGLTLEALLFWISWASKFNVQHPFGIIILFISLPYFFILFPICYSLSSAISIGNISMNKIIRQIFDKNK